MRQQIQEEKLIFYSVIRWILLATLVLMFAPVEIDDVLYADGGITNNFPVEPLVPLCRKLIGVYVNPLEMEKNKHSNTLFPSSNAPFISHDLCFLGKTTEL